MTQTRRLDDVAGVVFSDALRLDADLVNRLEALPTGELRKLAVALHTLVTRRVLTGAKRDEARATLERLLQLLADRELGLTR